MYPIVGFMGKRSETKNNRDILKRFCFTLHIVMSLCCTCRLTIHICQLYLNIVRKKLKKNYHFYNCFPSSQNVLMCFFYCYTLPYLPYSRFHLL